MGDALSGIGVGVAYGLVAAAIAIASRATRTLHLAIGPVVVLGALVHLILQADGRAPVLVTLAAGAAVGAVGSAAIEPLVLRPLSGATARAVGTFVVGAIVAVGAAQTLGARTVRPAPLLDVGDRVIAGTRIDGAAIAAMVVALPAVALLGWVLARTRWGARVRLVGGPPAAATRVGVRPGMVRLQALALAGAVGTVAVVLAAPMTLIGLPQAAGLTLRAVAAAFVARDRPYAALGVGIVMGVSEAMVQSAAPAIGGDGAVALVVLIALLARGGEHAQSWGRTW